MEVYAPPKPAATIPVIDLSLAVEDDGERAVADEMRSACVETGFFYVSGHGVDEALIAGQFEAARRFFALPYAEKLALDMKNSPVASGYEPIGGQVLDSQDADADAAPVDLKESFYCRTDPPAGPDAPAETDAENQWPDLPGFRAQTLAYGAAVQAVGDRILALLARSLSLAPDWFEPFYDGAPGRLRMLRYPPQLGDAAFNQIGAGAHTDWGGITILAQDDLGGLEVKERSGDWIVATPIPGTFVVNLGDLMMRWTNALYTSNMHRVRNNASDRDRYSLPFFYSPRFDAVIEAIPTCVDADHPRRFETCTSGEHIKEMFRRSYGFSRE